MGAVTRDYVINRQESVLVEVLEDYQDESWQKHITGDLILVKGPTTFVPRAEQKVVKIEKGELVRRNEALLLAADRGLVDDEGV